MNTISIEYINTYLNNYSVEFKVIGDYKGCNINENVILDLHQMKLNKIIKKNINNSLDFLKEIKNIKDNLNNRRIKNVLTNLAFKKHQKHQDEIKELTLMIELVNIKKEKQLITYDKNGNLIHH